MPEFSTVLETAHPEKVFDGVADLANWSSFTGWGPMPGIVKAELVEGQRVEAGARVRVTNTDGSVHHERFEEFERGRRLRIRMELGPPASRFLSSIVETLEWDGRRLVRHFVVTPRAWWTAPIARVLAFLLRKAALRHNALLAPHVQ